MKKKISLLLLTTLFIASFNSCCSDGKDEPKPKNSTSQVSEISGTITTDRDLTAEGIKNIYAITDVEETVGKGSIEGKKFTVKLETPKKFMDLTDTKVFPKSLKLSNPKANISIITSLFLQEPLDDEDEKNKVVCYNMNIALLQMKIKLNNISFIYASEDTTIKGESIETEENEFISENKLTANLNLKKGWNMVNITVTISEEKNKKVSTTEMKNIDNIPSSYKWQIGDEINNTLPFSH